MLNKINPVIYLIYLFSFAPQSTFNIENIMEKHTEDLKAIREMMEKSSKFLSLSGLSGIMAGVTAIAGALFAYLYLLRHHSSAEFLLKQDLLILAVDAILVLVISLGFAIYFSRRKAKKKNQKLLSTVVLNTMYNLGIPLAAGGILSIIMISRGQTELVAATTLIFYGLALVNVSKFTYGEVHYLGIAEIIIGLLAAVFIHSGLILWTIGFGICHVVYGFIMYKKYDLN